MIHVDRAAVPAPACLASAPVRALADEMKEHYTRRLKIRRQERFETPRLPDWAFTEVLEALRRLFHNKCGYCEAPFTGSRDGLDRFRPTHGALGMQRDYAPDHYWWLTYEWMNTYAACEICNRIKGPKFPVSGQRAPIQATWAEIAQEQRLLIDPCTDDPAADLEFLGNGMVRPRSNRGDVTIGVLELNRAALVKARKEVARRVQRRLGTIRRARSFSGQLNTLPSKPGWEHAALARLAAAHAGRSSLSAALGELVEAVAATAPFAAVARELVRPWLASLTSQQAAAAAPAVPAKRSRATRHVRLRTHYVSSVELRGFRGIADLRLQVPIEETDTAPWLMLLGENGTGKSSILQAIALALCGETHRRGIRARPASVLRQGAKSGFARVHLSGAEEPLALEFKRGAPRFTYKGKPPKRVVLAYGATRLLPTGDHRSSAGGMVRVRNLFDPFRPLLDADTWMAKLKPDRFDYVARALKDVLALPRSSRLRAVKKRGSSGIKLRLFGADLDPEQLSDGYQSVLGLTCDIIAGLTAGHEGALEAAEGIVLLDELGAHIHPRWRMRIVKSLRKAFPRVQFIVSTHDPLCLRGLENGEVAVLRRTTRGRIFAVPDLPPVKGMRVDQLLTSEYFGLNSTMDPDVEAKFNELYRLLALRKPTPAQLERTDQLREQLRPHDPPGTTRRERRLLQIIDNELARTDDEPDANVRSEIHAQANLQIAADLGKLLATPVAAR